MVYGSESPSSKRSRLVLSAVVWLIGLPLLVLLGSVLSWWIVLLAIPLAWATWDFIQRGGGDPSEHWWGG